MWSKFTAYKCCRSGLVRNRLHNRALGTLGARGAPATCLLGADVAPIDDFKIDAVIESEGGARR